MVVVQRWSHNTNIELKIVVAINSRSLFGIGRELKFGYMSRIVNLKNTITITFKVLFCCQFILPRREKSFKAKLLRSWSSKAGVSSHGRQATCGPPDAFVRLANIPKNDKIINFNQIHIILKAFLVNCRQQKFFFSKKLRPVEHFGIWPSLSLSLRPLL